VLILLPPSEGKKPGGSGRWIHDTGIFGRALANPRQLVAASLAQTLPTALKVRGATAEHAQRVNANLLGGPVLPAHERYSGVVYQGLDSKTMPAALMATAKHSIVAFSGLGGLVRFTDPLPDYRAPMDASIYEIGKLANYWRPLISPHLQRAAKREGVIDLLTQVHRSAVEPASENWFTVDLVHSDITGGHAAKFAKGRLARWLLEHEITELHQWNYQGWTAHVR
jgi:uncharacterized protein